MEAPARCAPQRASLDFPRNRTSDYKRRTLPSRRCAVPYALLYRTRTEFYLRSELISRENKSEVEAFRV